MSADEMVEHLAEDGTVQAVVPRAAIRAGVLLHRSVFIAVTTSDGRLVAHRRAGWKDLWPDRWDVAFGGVVGAGEAWDEAATRELAEEAGIEVPLGALERLGDGRFESAEVREVGRVYRVVHDGPFTCPDGEVAEVVLVPLVELAPWLTGRELTPDSEALVLPHLLEIGRR